MLSPCQSTGITIVGLLMQTTPTSAHTAPPSHSNEHIGGLATVPALLAALPAGDHRETIKTDVALTHRHSNVLRAADCLTRLLGLISEDQPLREALMQAAGDWFSTRKATDWSRQPDRVIIGQKLSPACYIDQSFPASLYLAWKYHDDFPAAVIANAKVGGDNCHRGAVVGSLVAAEVMRDTGVEPSINGNSHPIIVTPLAGSQIRDTVSP